MDEVLLGAMTPVMTYLLKYVVLLTIFMYSHLIHFFYLYRGITNEIPGELYLPASPSVQEALVVTVNYGLGRNLCGCLKYYLSSKDCVAIFYSNTLK